MNKTTFIGTSYLKKKNQELCYTYYHFISTLTALDILILER